MTSPSSPGSTPSSTGDVAATFCATLVDEWVRSGVAHAVVSPGSRSTPMTLALLRDRRIRVHVHLDERSASFFALGIGMATGVPAVVVCTSGTAAAELHPAVVEAHQARVPVVVVTTDRPPELRDVGAPQTIDQHGIFTTATRWTADPGVPDPAASATWRALAARAVTEATGAVPGPVHLNLPFREPLLGVAGPLPPPRDGARPWRRASHVARAGTLDLEALASAFAGRTGVVVAGAGIADPSAVHQLASALRWPVLADPRSGCRLPESLTISHADPVLRSPAFADAARPEAVLRLGDLPASKVVGSWLASLDAWQVLVHPHGTVIDPDHVVSTVLAADVGELCEGLVAHLPPPGGRAEVERDALEEWVARWCRADAEAGAAIAAVLASHVEPTEPATARAALAAVPDGGALVVGSSMPVRDVEWFTGPRRGAVVLANRGANGIDGVVSTAVGVAASGLPTVGLVGDVTLLHDSNGLLGLAGRGVDLTLVVVDNDGGGIFSFLPQARELPDDEFERAWGTPHGVDLAALARAHGLEVEEPRSAEEVEGAIRRSVAVGGARLVRVRTDRAANVAVHQEIDAAVRAAVGTSVD